MLIIAGTPSDGQEERYEAEAEQSTMPPSSTETDLRLGDMHEVSRPGSDATVDELLPSGIDNVTIGEEVRAGDRAAPQPG